MADDQQPAAEVAAGDNVMEKVLGTFDGIVDNATAAVGGAASAVKGVGANIVEKGGEVTSARRDGHRRRQRRGRRHL